MQNLKVKRKLKKIEKEIRLVFSRGGGSREGEVEEGDQKVQILS